VSIGTAIRAAREARGWSQPDLASRVKAARETISRWETGDLQPTERTLVALEAILGPLEVKEESKPNPKRRRKS
jgi:ribosome-binding protein aMBF1 (putative translation factor)